VLFRSTPEEGQLLTEIEKFAAVHLERLEYRDFEPSDPPKKYKAEKEAERKRKEETHRSRYDTAVSSTEKSEDADQGAFPSGVVPKGPPRKTLGSRLRTRRGKR